MKYLENLIEQGILKPKPNKPSEEAAQPTYEVVHQPKPCEDCGVIVTNRILNTRLNKVPFAHYKQQCSICKKYLNPETGAFDCDLPQLNAYYRYKHK